MGFSCLSPSLVVSVLHTDVIGTKKKKKTLKIKIQCAWASFASILHPFFLSFFFLFYLILVNASRKKHHLLWPRVEKKEESIKLENEERRQVESCTHGIIIHFRICRNPSPVSQTTTNERRGGGRSGWRSWCLNVQVEEMGKRGKKRGERVRRKEGPCWNKSGGKETKVTTWNKERMRGLMFVLIKTAISHDKCWHFFCSHTHTRRQHPVFKGMEKLCVAVTSNPNGLCNKGEGKRGEKNPG